MTTNKKGQVQSLILIIQTIVIIGLLLGVGFLVLEKFQATTFTSTSGSVSNETITSVTEAGKYLSKYSLRDAACSVSLISNATGGETITSGNYTITNCLVASTGAEYNNTNWNVTYSYTYNADTSSSNATGKTLTALYEIPNTWLGVIITVVIAAIILLIVLGVFGGRKAR